MAQLKAEMWLSCHGINQILKDPPVPVIIFHDESEAISLVFCKNLKFHTETLLVLALGTNIS